MANSQPDQGASNTLLLADLEHFGQSLWRNEEVGEKRFNFFITLVTAVIAGLVAFHTADPPPSTATLSGVTNGALVGLLVFGFMTYLRMLQRNRVTDEYKQTLRYLRRSYLDLNPNPKVKEYEVPVCQDWGLWKWLRGGLAETVGAVWSVVFGALLMINDVDVAVATLAAGATLAIAWAVAAPRKG